MNHRNQAIPNLAGIVSLALALASFGTAAPIRPFAQEHVVVGESPSPSDTPLYSPSILRLDSGRLVAAYTRATKDTAKQGPGNLITFHRVTDFRQLVY